jgi:GNAT superfamily N-acetyltransferase
MEIIELNVENIKTYLEQALKLQEFLVSDPTRIDGELFEETARDNHSFFLALVEGDKLLGVGVLSKMAHPVNITAYINNIVVHPDARGKGLFGVIMDALEGKAKDWGCTDLALTCSREKVQGMYEKRGYKQKETNFYLLKI